MRPQRAIRFVQAGSLSTALKWLADRDYWVVAVNVIHGSGAVVLSQSGVNVNVAMNVPSRVDLGDVIFACTNVTGEIMQSGLNVPVVQGTYLQVFNGGTGTCFVSVYLAFNA